MKTTLVSFFMLALLATQPVKGQSRLTTFKEGKALFDKEQYALAASKLAPLTSLKTDNDMVRYASFYYAISSYYANDAATAGNMFRQIARHFPGWEKQNEVSFWLGKLSFEEKNYRQAISYLSGIQGDEYKEDIQALKDHHFGQLTDENLLRELLQENPGQSVLASQLAREILKKPVAEQDIELLDKLSSQHGLHLNLQIEGIEFSPKKEIYNVGVFLPFNYRDDSVSLKRLQNEWTVRFYEGLKLAVEKLVEEGLAICITTFDTRSNQASLKRMLASENAQSLDLIIGPVFQRSVLQVSAFAKAHKINMINPLSSNGEVIKDNPFAFLYYPANESLALAAANYARKHFTKNKNAAVFYSGPGDRRRAELYKNILEKDSFNIPVFQRIRAQESSKIQQLFVQKEEVQKDSVEVAQMMAEMDSLKEAGVEDWKRYDERDFVYNTLRILPDSIGHIYVASDVASLAASAVSAIDARPDTIFYLSSSRWLSSEQSVNFAQLERINAIFTGSNRIDYSTEAVSEFRARYELAFNAYPRKADRLGDAYLGYDIMMTYGRLLHQYGQYFQIGIKRKKEIKGVLTHQFDYRFSNDNRFIPIFRVTDSQLVDVVKTSEANDQN